MEPRLHIGVLLVTAGAVLLVAGLAVLLLGHLPLPGRLPGDFTFQGRGWRVYVPLASGMVISLILTVVLNIFLRR